MLVLSRKKNESIILSGAGIADRIKITCCQIRPGQVRLGIEAPPSVEIARGELMLRTVWGDVPIEEMP
jgi:carbon storage regulator CsrA